MTREELEEYILEKLPKILEENPRFVTFIEGIVAEKFPRRDEFARLLDQVQYHGQETRNRLDRVENVLQEHSGRFDRVESVLQEHTGILQEHSERFDRVENVLQEHTGILQEHTGILQEHTGILQEHSERFDRVENELQNHRRETAQRFDELEFNLQRSIDRLGARWGIRNEAVFRQVMKSLLEDSFGVAVEERHIKGEQFDVVIYNGEHVLVEITASAGRHILERLQRKRQLYIDEVGVVPARFILAVGSIHSRRAQSLREAGFEVVEPEIDETGEEILEIETGNEESKST